MDWETIITLMENGNTGSTSFIAHEGLVDELGATITSFANSRGGTICVGMDLKSYHLRGTDATELSIDQLIQTDCSPYVQIKTETVHKNDKRLFIILVGEGGLKPYFYKRNCYVRDDGVNRLATVEEERELAEAKSQTPKATIVQFARQGEETNDGGVMNDRQKQTLQFLQTRASIRNKEYRDMFSVSHKTAHLELIDLVQKGHIKSQGSGRSTCYVLTEQPDSSQTALAFEPETQA